MKIALYNENLGELEILLGQLDQCAREYLRFVEITPYVRQEDLRLIYLWWHRMAPLVWRLWSCCGRKDRMRIFFGFRIWILPCVPIGTMRTGLGKSLWIFIACGKPLDRFCIGENAYDSVIEKNAPNREQNQIQEKEEVLSISDRK